MKGSKGILSGLKDLENSSSSNQVKNNTKSNKKIRKSFLVEEYYENLLKVIKFQRNLSQTDIIKGALENFANEEEKEKAKNLTR